MIVVSMCDERMTSLNETKTTNCVLLVEDNESDARGVRLFLESRKVCGIYNIVWQRSLTAAIKSLEKDSPDVILLDLGLPDSSGVESVKTLVKLANCPLVVLSGMENERLAMQTVECGAQDYLMKDELNQATLDRAIRYAIERYRVLRELKVAKKDAEAGKVAKSNFLAVMSHEFCTPMNGIFGGLNLLEDTCKDPESHELVAMVLQCAETQRSLIEDVLDIVQVDSGKLTVSINPFNLKNLINSAISEALVKCREKGVLLSVDIDPSVPNELCSDPARVRQVLSNILSNAVKFTHEGEIHVRVRMMENGFVEFRVSDTGIGITPIDICKIFDNFTQVDSSYSRSYEGAGLGLAICKRFVAMLGGTIEVESEFGRGSEFRFTVACDVPSNGSEIEKQISMQPIPGFAETHPLSILIVEDNLLARESLLMQLSQFGYKAIEAHSGSHALDITLEESFDLVFMDLRMPHLNGFETAPMLIERQLDRVGYSPYVAAVTASVSPKVEEDCFEAEIAILLSKPVQNDELRRVLDMAFNRKFARTV